MVLWSRVRGGLYQLLDLLLARVSAWQCICSVHSTLTAHLVWLVLSEYRKRVKVIQAREEVEQDRLRAQAEAETARLQKLEFLR